MADLEYRSRPALPGNEDRSDARVRKAMTAPALRTFFRIAEAWRLSGMESRALLGWPAFSTYHKYKAGDVGTLSYDTLMRISLVIGIYKALHILYPDAGLADRWVKLPNLNPMFVGKSAIAYMAGNGIDALNQVRRLLDARRGGT